MDSGPSDLSAYRGIPALRWMIALIFVAAFVAYAVISWRWPLIHDMQVMHYVSFLIDRGWAPYRQIGDMNMPGAYLFEHWALTLFGNSDLGWRLYDITLCVLMTAAMISIARPYDWLAGLVAGGTFTLMHAADGPRDAGQRDQVIGLLLVIASAVLMEAVRTRREWMLFFFVLIGGLAASIKPFVAPLVPLLLLLAWMRNRSSIRLRAFLAWSLAGLTATTAIVLGFLLVHGSLQAFIHLLAVVLPNYLTLGNNLEWRVITRSLFPPVIILLAGFGLLATVEQRRGQTWEEVALLCGAFFGSVSYLVQRKGFDQHRYPMLIFLLTWASIQIFVGLRGHGRARVFAALGLITALLYLPYNVSEARTWPSHDYYSQYLAQDLAALGTGNLQHSVQCLDIVDGCLNALFHLQVEQSNGSTGDLLLFVRSDAGAVQAARAEFFREVTEKPPALFVVSNWVFGDPNRSFHKLDSWPAFKQYLESNYVLTAQREFKGADLPTSTLGSDPNWPAYRLYIRKGSPLLASHPTRCRDLLVDYVQRSQQFAGFANHVVGFA